jgi:hypothetical protein
MRCYVQLRAQLWLHGSSWLCEREGRGERKLPSINSALPRGAGAGRSPPKRTLNRLVMILNPNISNPLNNIIRADPYFNIQDP